MKYHIRKEFHFSAAHTLLGLAEDHPCGRHHGHNYVVEVELAAEELDSNGWVRDYGDLEDFKRYLDSHVDHRDLNVVFTPMQTTAELIAERFWEQLAGMGYGDVLYAVHVSETPKTWATYHGLGDR